MGPAPVPRYLECVEGILFILSPKQLSQICLMWKGDYAVSTTISGKHQRCLHLFNTNITMYYHIYCGHNFMDASHYIISNLKRMLALLTEDACPLRPELFSTVMPEGPQAHSCNAIFSRRILISLYLSLIKQCKKKSQLNLGELIEHWLSISANLPMSKIYYIWMGASV